VYRCLDFRISISDLSLTTVDKLKDTEPGDAG
jgi:hypothetical protein